LFHATPSTVRMLNPPRRRSKRPQPRPRASPHSRHNRAAWLMAVQKYRRPRQLGTAAASAWIEPVCRLRTG
jgi:hypothetical protein